MLPSIVGWGRVLSDTINCFVTSHLLFDRDLNICREVLREASPSHAAIFCQNVIIALGNFAYPWVLWGLLSLFEDVISHLGYVRTLIHVEIGWLFLSSILDIGVECISIFLLTLKISFLLNYTVKFAVTSQDYSLINRRWCNKLGLLLLFLLTCDQTRTDTPHKCWIQHKWLLLQDCGFLWDTFIIKIRWCFGEWLI